MLTSTICATYAQASPFTGQCVLTSSPTQVRMEGLTERMGALILQCSGSNPGAVLTGNLGVFLPVDVTNRVDANNIAVDATVSVNYGGGLVPLPVPGVVGNHSISFNGISVTVPASGSLTLQVSNIRAAAYELGVAGNQPILAQITFPVTLTQSSVNLAFTQPGLLALLYDQGEITCTGSPVPTTPTVANLFAAGTNFATTRLTEGFAGAFQPRGTGDDTGTRFLLQYSGFPANTQLYLPDMVAGSDAAVPSSGGDLGLPQQVGQYVPGSGTLLLVRVPNAGPTGAGSSVSAPTGTGPIALNPVSPVALTNGSGYAVYEVVDASPTLRESAQIPTFVGLASVTAPAIAHGTVTFAPVSTVATASTSAPVPRFEAVPPADDCTALGDCNAGYFPQLSVVSGPIQLTALAGATGMTSQPGYIPVHNVAGGVMNWTVTIQYGTGSGWLTLDNTSGTNNGEVRVWALPQALTAGAYQANLIIDGGGYAGSATIPVTLTVSPAASTSTGTGTGTNGSGTTSTGTTSTGTTGPAAPSVPVVTVSQVLNAATLQPTPLVAGSLGTIMGSDLAGHNVSVTFDGLAANLLYTGASQINLQLPAALAGKNSSSMVVTVDANSSAPQTVVLAPAWPAIFSNGVLNQDYTPNGSGTGAAAGSILILYGTGIPDGATVAVQMGARQGLVPLYAGDAPDIPGVQQVNVEVPGDLLSGTVPLVVCAGTGSLTACSPASAVTVR